MRLSPICCCAFLAAAYFWGEVLPQCLYRTDREGRFTFASAAFVKMVNRSQAQCVGNTVFDLYPDDLAEVYSASLQQVVNTSQSLQTVEAPLKSTAVQSEIASRQLVHPSSPIGPYLTVSMGIARTLPTGKTSSSDLGAAADAALYQAKRRGRNGYWARIL